VQSRTVGAARQKCQMLHEIASPMVVPRFAKRGRRDGQNTMVDRRSDSSTTAIRALCIRTKEVGRMSKSPT